MIELLKTQMNKSICSTVKSGVRDSNTLQNNIAHEMVTKKLDEIIGVIKKHQEYMGEVIHPFSYKPFVVPREVYLDRLSDGADFWLQISVNDNVQYVFSEYEYKCFLESYIQYEIEQEIEKILALHTYATDKAQLLGTIQAHQIVIRTLRECLRGYKK